jgi:hypothetical protein
MAPEIERCISAAIISGQLTVIAAKVCAIESKSAEGVIDYRRCGQKRVETIHVDKIVECRGISAVLLKVVNPVLRSLLAAGLARLVARSTSYARGRSLTPRTDRECPERRQSPRRRHALVAQQRTSVRTVHRIDQEARKSAPHRLLYEADRNKATTNIGVNK